MAFSLSSNYGHIHFGHLYIGWNNSNQDGEETFGLCIWRFYIGHYDGTGWCAGFLNEYGYLN